MSYYIHSIPGRLRIKSPRIKNNDDAVHELRKVLGTIEGVATIDVNLLTGSLLVNYNPKRLKESDILSVLERRGYYDAAKALTNDEYIHGAASKAGHFLGRTLFGACVDTALQGSGLSILAVFI